MSRRCEAARSSLPPFYATLALWYAPSLNTSATSRRSAALLSATLSSKPEMLLFGSRGHPALVERLIRLPKEYEIINTYSFLGLSPALLNGSFNASSPSPPPPPGLRRAEEAFAAALIASRPPQRGKRLGRVKRTRSCIWTLCVRMRTG